MKEARLWRGRVGLESQKSDGAFAGFPSTVQFSLFLQEKYFGEMNILSDTFTHSTRLVSRSGRNIKGNDNHTKERTACCSREKSNYLNQEGLLSALRISMTSDAPPREHEFREENRISMLVNPRKA